MTRKKKAQPPELAGVELLAQEYERGVLLSSLHEWPGNPKDHDVGAIVEMMRANGRYGVVYAQTSSRRLLAGHGRKKAYGVLGVLAVDVLWIDCDDATGARIVAADNRAAELGGMDEDALLRFLTEQSDAENLAGTGYDDDDLESLRRRLDGEDAEPAGDETDDVDSDADAEPDTATCPECGHTFPVKPA